MRIFAGDKMKSAMQRLGMEEDVPIESAMVSRAIERAQKQVEQRNFEIRKHLLEYDDVNNKQRTEIYSTRRELLAGQGAEGIRARKAPGDPGHLVDEYLGAHKDPGDWDLSGSASRCATSSASTRSRTASQLAETAAGRGSGRDLGEGWRSATRPRKRRSAPS